MLSPDADTKFMYWVPKKLEFVNQQCVGVTLTLEDENKVPCFAAMQSPRQLLFLHLLTARVAL